jgi:hypothetical protein
MIQGVKSTSIYDAIGWPGLLNVVWNSTPYPLRFVSLPYGLYIYGSFLKASSNLQQLLSVHAGRYMSSTAFRLFRPRYSRVQRILRSYGIEA